MRKDEIDLLDKTLSKTNDWLKFAEAKNGAIIAIVCTVMFGVIRAVANLEEFSVYLLFYLISFFILSLLSLIIALSSFIPKLKKPFWFNFDETNCGDNPFFFGDVCKYDGRSYLKLLEIPDDSENKILEKMADQIVVNSRIASVKYTLFTGAVWLFIAALITPLGAGLIWLFKE